MTLRPRRKIAWWMIVIVYVPFVALVVALIRDEPELWIRWTILVATMTIGLALLWLTS
jgi:hypothetical protein